MDAFRDGLRGDTSWSSGVTDYASKSHRTNRPSDKDYILTAWPDQDPFYPLIIVSEGPNTGGHISSPPRGLDRIDYDVELMLHDQLKTDLYKLRDEVRDWVRKNRVNLAENHGFNDASIQSGPQPALSDRGRVYQYSVTVNGEVYAS